MGVDLTPAEARILARGLHRLVRSGQAPPVGERPRADVDQYDEPIPVEYHHGVPQYPCPRRVDWCDGHSKREIKDARTPGNTLLHQTLIGAASFTIGDTPGSVRVELEREDEPGKQPFAYMQIIDGDGGAELDAASIDQLIAVLRQARAAILADNSDLTMRGATAGFTSHRRTIATNADNPHRLAALASRDAA